MLIISAPERRTAKLNPVLESSLYAHCRLDVGDVISHGFESRSHEPHGSACIIDKRPVQAKKYI